MRPRGPGPGPAACVRPPPAPPFALGRGGRCPGHSTGGSPQPHGVRFRLQGRELFQGWLPLPALFHSPPAAFSQEEYNNPVFTFPKDIYHCLLRVFRGAKAP